MSGHCRLLPRVPSPLQPPPPHPRPSSPPPPPKKKKKRKKNKNNKKFKRMKGNEKRTTKKSGSAACQPISAIFGYAEGRRSAVLFRRVFLGLMKEKTIETQPLDWMICLVS